MRTLSFRSRVRAAAVIAGLLVPGQVHAQDSVAAARDLYASAAYDDALTVLNRLDVSGRPFPDRLEVNQYRAFCLVALRRTEEAEKAIEAIVADEPLYRPSGADASPRLVSAFTTVRQRMLPSIVQQMYGRAKTAFDKQDFATAITGFEQVLKLLGDTDLGDAASRPPLSDMRMLATGFRDLGVRALPPPVAVAPASVPPPLPTAVLNRIYSMSDEGVSLPVIVRQDLPNVPHTVIKTGTCVLEVIINEDGTVDSALMRAPLEPHYDAMVLAATKSWRFKPATVGGTPVKFRKLISISIKP
jgi:TonB family protein